MYILWIYIKDISVIYNVYTWYIHSILACILHPVANFYFAPLLSTLGILALVNVDVQGTPGTENSRLEQRINCHSRNIRYIQGIYQRLGRGQAAGSGCSPGPRAIYSIPALCLGLYLTSTRISPIFSRDTIVYTL